MKLLQVEEFLHFVPYLKGAEEETKGRLDYLIRCLEDDIPYMGFFDSVYSPQRPFRL